MSARQPLPDLVIAGAPKAGSSALHAALRQHPRLFLSAVKEPGTLDDVCRFLGVETEIVMSVPRDNTRPFVADSPRRAVLSRVVRAGAGAGAFFSPQLWRRASRPILRAMHGGQSPMRPELTPQQRRRILAPLLPDLDLLESVTGQDFADWRSDTGKGSFVARQPVRNA